MSIATGVVRHGQLVLEGDDEPLPEGRRFTVLIDDDDDGVGELSAEQVKMLLDAQARIRNGDFVTLEQMLKDIDGA
jgi:hypothetical protein